MNGPSRNMYNKAGRSSKYKTPAEMSGRCMEYFDQCVAEDEKATLTGLALYLGFSRTEAFKKNAKRGVQWADVIDRAKLAVENSYEMNGRTIDIFALKQLGWSDKHEHVVEQTNITVEV